MEATIQIQEEERTNEQKLQDSIDQARREELDINLDHLLEKIGDAYEQRNASQKNFESIAKQCDDVLEGIFDLSQKIEAYREFSNPNPNLKSVQ